MSAERLQIARALIAGIMGAQLASLIAAMTVSAPGLWLVIAICGVAITVPPLVFFGAYVLNPPDSADLNDTESVSRLVRYAAHGDALRRRLLPVAITGGAVWFVGLLGHISGWAAVLFVLALSGCAAALAHADKDAPEE